jgi:hypothetical protein
MRRTGQIPRLALTRRRPVNVGPMVKEGDLLLILLARQRFALQAAIEALGGDGEGRNRTETEIRKSRLTGLLEIHEGVQRWIPRDMKVRAAREEAGW